MPDLPEGDAMNLPNGWVETTLREVAKKVYSGGTPSTKNESYYGGDIPWVRTQEVKFNYIKDTEIKISEEGFNSSSAKWIPKNTVIIAMYGNSAGRVAYSQIEATTNQACCNFIADKRKSDSRFIYFNLLHRYSEIKGKANGAAQQNLSVGVLKELNINLPPLPEQKAIADMLSSFDDKIELLREQNKTLETLAQTIFKEWFVKFNAPQPPEGGEKSQPPEGRENNTVSKGDGGKSPSGDLGAMVDSELGLIPKGWRVGCIGDALELMYGKTLKTENRSGAGFPVYGSNGVVGYHKDYLVKGAGIIVGRKGSMGKVIWCHNDFFPIDTAFYVVDKIGLNDLFFHYFLLKRIDFERVSSDSAVPGLNRNAAYSIDAIIPELEVIKKFNGLCASLFDKVENNAEQIQTLSKTRDTLLPRLMNGQVRVN